MELTDVPGVGAAKAERLRSAGIRTVKQLAEIDLRQNPDTGIGPDVLKRAKNAARKLCDQEGIAYQKASYGAKSGGKSTTGTKAAAGTKATAKPAGVAMATGATSATGPGPADAATNGATNGASAKKPGLFARLFKRAS